MSSQIALVANEAVRASTERTNRSDVVVRAGQMELVKTQEPTASTTPTPVEKEAPELQNAVDTVRSAATDMQRRLQFSVDEDSGRTIITVIDRESGKIIRQIPPEELLQIADRVADGGNLNLIDGRA